jgi:hypothetical protein
MSLIKHHFPRKTSALAKRALEFTDCEMYSLENFFPENTFLKVGVCLKFKVTVFRNLLAVPYTAQEHEVVPMTLPRHEDVWNR